LLGIPLSLSIIKLLLCQAHGVNYALAVETVEQILLPQPENIRWLGGQKIIHRHNGQTECTVPIYKLSNLVTYSQRVANLSVFGAESVTSTQHTPASSEVAMFKTAQLPILLLRHGTELCGLEVDQIMGEQELVIRPLGNAIAPPKYVYGASILSNSRMALAIDVALLVNQFLDSSNLRQIGEHYALPPTANQSPPTAPSLLRPAPLIPVADLADRRTAPKILVVDDSVTMRQTLASTLQKAGYQVLQATDGLEALLQLQQHAGSQLGVICDVEMPRMNGFEFLNQCRQHPDLSSIPVVMLTSRSGAKYRQIAFELGAAGYLTKPYSEQELLVTVSDLLHQTTQDLVLS